jgi:peptidoglycan/LPS O-acetylase OafA/YrhL
MPIAYRADIDGLRAIAVLAIVIFHAQLSVFPGGFVGVDIFFVISGFLITRGIQEDIENKDFSILRFYERRIRRIVPALLVMLALTTLAVVLIAFPSEMRDYAPTLIGALLFGSNLVFWQQEGYFAPVAEEKPLLHTWSLGVEEQFYIFIPLIMVMIARFCPRRLHAIMLALTLLSFALCVVMTLFAPNAAFYLLPSRAWELLAGACVGLGVFPRVSRPSTRNLATLLGLVLIFGSLLFVHEKFRFPGPTAAIPVLGAALILAFGAGTSLGSAVLANAPARFIGRISYSLYLWHWPLIVFPRLYGHIDGKPFEGVAVSALSILAGWLSWRFVEQPFRDRKRFSASAIYRLAGVSAAVSLAYAGAVFAADGWPARFTPAQIAFETHPDRSPFHDRCHQTGGNLDPGKSCVLGAGTPHMVVWADSHGGELSLALSEKHGAVQSITYSACPPAIGWRNPSRPLCKAHNDATVAYIEANKQFDTVVLSAYFEQVIGDPAFRRAFKQSVTGLLAAGKHVIVVGPTPAERFFSLPKQLARNPGLGLSRNDYDRAQARVLPFLREIRHLGAQVWMPADTMCDASACMLTVDGRAVLFDDNHLSMAGARFLARREPFQITAIMAPLRIARRSAD